MRRKMILPWVLVLILGLSMGLGACGKKADKADSNAPAGTDQATNEDNETSTRETTPPPAQAPAEPRRAPRHEPSPPPAPAIQQVTLASGTTLLVTLDRELTTKIDQAGAQFTAITKEPIVVDGITAVPTGSTVRGVVTTSKRAPRLGGDADMTLEFTSVVLPGGRTVPISADPITFKGKSSTKGDIEKVVGGAVGGGVLGGVLGGKKGAVKGAAAGTVAGGIWAAATRGQDLYVTQGTEMNVTLTAPVQMTVNRGERS